MQKRKDDLQQQPYGKPHITMIRMLLFVNNIHSYFKLNNACMLLVSDNVVGTSSLV